MLLLFIFNSNKYHRMEPKDIRIHKEIAEKIKIVNYAHKIQSTWQLINMELKQNLLEICKNSCRSY